MPKIDMNEYNDATGSFGCDFEQMLPGAYIVRIQAVRTDWEEYDFDAGGRVHKTADADQSVMLVFDVDEGPHAGEFSRDFYMDDGRLDERKDWMHWWKYGWWNVNRLKAANYVLEACNPGFDPMAAFSADRWELFVGKRFGVVLNGTVKTNERGYDQWTLRPQAKIVTLEDVRNGNHAEPKVTDRRYTPTEQAGNAPKLSSLYDEDDSIPFM